MNTEMPIKKIKTSKIVYVRPEDTMMRVEDIFDNFSIHHILVVENEILRGIISKSDLLKVYISHANEGKVPDRNKIFANDIMTQDPITLDTEDTIGLAADLFLSNKIHSVPVLNGDQLSGIITNHDLLKYCFR
ncbi:MAG: CBS domain-containing protein [Saprospiraceae bacterium]|jgi:acetoin utilization protein AcuB|nr:CBS domain-containing protein [Saprospiraceae bacterium]